MNFTTFINELVDNPLIFTAFILLIIVMIMNGVVDAPNGVATTIATRALYIDHALVLSTVCNFLGVLAISLTNAKVSLTIYNLIDFTTVPKGNHAIVAALLGIIVYMIISWIIRIPTSSSHAIVAVLIGSSLAVHGGFSGISSKAVLAVLIGIVISIFVAYFLGIHVNRLIIKAFRYKDRRESKKTFDKLQIISGGMMSFAHGLQDGQKLIGILMIMMATMGYNHGEMNSFGVIPFWLQGIVALTMGIGTIIGIKKVVKSIGMKVANLESFEGFASNISAFTTVIVASLIGIPISTTQTSVMAIMGAGVAKRKSNVNWDYVKYLSRTWFLTFPLCGIISFILTKILIAI